MEQRQSKDKLTDWVTDHSRGRMMSLSNHKQRIQIVLVHDRIKTTLSSNELHLGLGLSVLDRVNLGGGKRAFQDLLTVMTGRHLDVGVFLVETVRLSRVSIWELLPYARICSTYSMISATERHPPSPPRPSRYLLR
jgi:hypothetical protein